MYIHLIIRYAILKTEEIETLVLSIKKSNNTIR